MGRKPVNDYEETSIGLKKGSEFRLFDVKLPFAVQVTFKRSLSPNIDPCYGTATDIIYKTMNEKSEIVTHYEKLGCLDVKVKPWMVKLTDVCPVCMTDGIPRIEPKDTKDNRYRNWKHQEPRHDPLPIRPEEYWLVYFHNKIRNKCRVSQCVSTPHPALKDNTEYEITMKKYLFPMCLEWMKDIIYKNSDDVV